MKGPTLLDCLVFLAVPFVAMGATVGVALVWWSWDSAWIAGGVAAVVASMAYIALGLVSGASLMSHKR